MSKQTVEFSGLETVRHGNGSNPPLGKILVVDDEPKLRSVLVESLQRQGFEVAGCSSGSDALAKLRGRDFDLLLTDLMMPNMDGIALLKNALEIDPHLVGIMITGQGTIQTAVDAMQMGAFDYVLKPFHLQTLMPVLTRAMDVRHLKLENVQLRETIAIHGLCQTIAFTLDPQTLLSKLADAALQQSDADEVSILLPTSDGTELYVAAVRGKNRERLLGERVSLKDSISSWVARARKPLILNGEVHDERFVALWPRPEIRSAVSVPLQLANKLVGIINLNVTNRLRPFTLGQMKALTILASTAAAALESASLYIQVQEAEKNYHSLFHNAIEGIFRATSEKLLTVNPSMAGILGYDSPEELVHNLTEISKQLFVKPALAVEIMQKLEEQGVVQGAEFEAYRKNRERIWLSLNMRIVRDDNGSEICREGTLEDITERKRADAERLVMFEMSQGVSNSADVEALLTLVHQVIQKVVYAENCFVALYDEQTDTLGMQFFVDKYDPTPAPQKLGKSCTAHVFRTGESLLLNQKRFDQLIEAGQVELLGKPSPSWLGVPLNTPAKTIGVLVVQHYEDDHAYSQRDVDFLSSVGGQIAIAIERKQAAETLAKSEAEMRAFFAAMTDVIFVLDADGRYQRIAPTDPTYLYDASAQLLGKTLHEVLPKAEADLFLKHVHRALAEGKAHKIEYYLQIDGVQVWFDGSVAPMDEQSVIWIARDVTERKRAEEERDRLTGEIENQRQRLNNIVATVPGVVWEAWGEPDGATQRIDFISSYIEPMLGYSVSEWTSTPNFWLSVVHPDDREGAAAIAAEGYASGKAATMEFRWIAKNGREVWVESNFVIVTDDTGKAVGMRGVNTDIGERKRAEEALRHSEERYRDLVENAQDLIYEHDLQGNFTASNKAGERITGYTLEETLKLNLGLSVAPDYLEKAQEMLQRKLAGESVTAYDLVIVAKDGHRVPVEVNTRLVFRDGVPVGVQGIARDITERKRADEVLRESEERYRLLFESNPQPMWVYDLETLAFLAVNESAVRHYGYSRQEFLAMTIKDIRPVEDLSALYDSVGVSEPDERGVWRHLKKDGVIIYVEVTSHLLVFDDRQAELILAHDITERTRLEAALLASEAQLRQSQKLEAIGQLAGGVAHDFNNLLTVIGGYSSILLGKLPPESPHRTSIEEIKKAGDRASALTRQLLAFSRKQILQPKVLDLNVVITDLEKMVRRLIGEDIDLLTMPAPGLGKVKADPGQIEQVLLNLIVNARDAMPKGGKLTIETRNVLHSEEYAQRHATPAGPYVMLAVSDTGCGMDATTQPRVFEPFFTTKASGKGTGLGLATVYGIVKQSGGNIWVYSELDRGSTFKIYLPRVDEMGDEEAVVSRSIPQGTELILLVEDEDQVRAILTHILEDQGYQVLAASNGAEALSISQNLELDIKLMMTDVVMPHMSGRELAERVLTARPDLSVLFMSGYTDDAIVRHGLLDEKLNFIQKPFDSASVARKVREVLDSHVS